MHSILAMLVLKRGIPTSIKFRTRGKQLEDGVLGELEMHLPGAILTGQYRRGLTIDSVQR